MGSGRGLTASAGFSYYRYLHFWGGVTIRLASVYINVFQLYESTGNACQFFEKKLFTQDSSPRKRQVHHVYHQTVQSFSSETISEMGLSSDRTQPPMRRIVVH